MSHRTDPASSSSDTLRWSLLIGGLATLLLLPLLLFGPGADPALFYVGARKLVDGGVYYRDVLDIKPPFIYWFYAGALSLFGESFTAARLLDLLIHAIFLFLLSRTMLRIGFARAVVAATVLLYALITIGLGPENTTQLESYVGPLLLAAVVLQMRARRRGTFAAYALCGIPYGAMLLLKPTLILLLLGWIIYELARPVMRRGPLLARVAAGLGVALVPYAIWMAFATFGPHQQTIAELNAFIGDRHIRLLTSFSGLTAAMNWLVTRWGTHYGPTLLLLIALGAAVMLRRASRHKGIALDEEMHDRTQLFTEIVALQGLMLLLSCAAELWFFVYHISRMLLPMALLAGIGVVAIARRIADRRRYSAYHWAFGGLLLILLLIYSPATRYVASAARPGVAFLRSGSLAAAQRASLDDLSILASFDSLGLDQRFRRAENPVPLFIISPNVGMLHAVSGTVPRNTIIQGHQIASRFTPPAWTARVLRMLRDDPPALIVIEWTDPSIGIQNVATTEEGLREAGLLDSIRERYRTVDSNGVFVVMERREGEGGG